VIRLGQTEPQVSRIGFGTWAYGGDWGAADVDDAKASIHGALELGIDLFDTGQGYGLGAAERLLGEALWERARRKDVVIATKGGLRMEGDRVLRDASRAWLAPGVESSLRSLGTGYIDIYQVHWPDLRAPPEQTAGALEDLVGQGKIRHAGVSSYDVGQTQALRAAGRLETLEPPYHLFRREIEEQILPWCARHDVAVLVCGPTGPRAAVGPDAPVDGLRPRRLAQQEPGLHRRDLPPQPGGGQAAEGFRRPAGASACRSWRWPGRWPTRRCTPRSWARACRPSWTAPPRPLSSSARPTSSGSTRSS
jgi:aryl-alcohol dehydrogenase-like predicted oxidoreductase